MNWTNSFALSVSLKLFLQQLVALNVLGVACSTHRQTRKCMRSVGRKSEGRRPVWRSRFTWKGNSKTDLTERVWKDTKSIRVAQNGRP